MRVLRFRLHASVSGSLLSIAIVVLLAACWGGSQAAARQTDPTPTPEVANLPAGTEVVVSADLDVAAGDYEWHVTEFMTANPGDQPLTVHRGLLFAVADAVLVSHEDAALDQVAKGQALRLEEGEKILPVSLTGAPVALTLTELVRVMPPATPVPAPPSGLPAPRAMEQGHYIIALLHLPLSSQNDAFVETIAAAAAGPVAEITPVEQGAPPEAADRERWIVALFVPPAPGSGQPAPGSGQGSAATGGTPTVTPTTTMTPTAATTSTSTISPTATSVATTMPTATEPPIGSGGFGTDRVLNPANTGRSLADDDKDGLTNDGEAAYGTDPLDADTDGDSLSDGPEVDYGTNPLAEDSDDDGLGDYAEIGIHSTDPLAVDSDGDGLGDGAEINSFGTNPLAEDSDGDGLRDNEEFFDYGTDPLRSDTDGDGDNDYDEVQARTNPLVP